jgi:hypothetical protein
MIDQKQQVQDWLANLPMRHLIALASQHKLVSYANKPRKHLVEELEVKGDVQQQALEMIQKGIKTHGEGVQSG